MIDRYQKEIKKIIELKYNERVLDPSDTPEKLNMVSPVEIKAFPQLTVPTLSPAKGRSNEVTIVQPRKRLRTAPSLERQESILWQSKSMGALHLRVRTLSKDLPIPPILLAPTDLRGLATVKEHIAGLEADDERKLDVLLGNARATPHKIAANINPEVEIIKDLPCCAHGSCTCGAEQPVADVEVIRLHANVLLLPAADRNGGLYRCNSLMRWLMPTEYNRLVQELMPLEERKRLGTVQLKSSSELLELAMCRNVKESNQTDLTDEKYLEKFSKSCGLVINLRDYQYESVRWMIDRESTSIFSSFFGKLHFSSGFECWYSPIFQEFCFQEALPPVFGGILAEQMGLGKTIEMIALINHNTPDSIGVKTFSKAASLPTKATLILTPPSLLGQWHTELKEKVSIPYNIICFATGFNGRPESEQDLLDYDIVLITYSLLCTWGTESILHRLRWHRIIIDESHFLKNPSSRQSQVVCSLQSQRRWLLTGTPINNGPLDVLGQARFLGFDIATKPSFIELARRVVQASVTANELLIWSPEHEGASNHQTPGSAIWSDSAAKFLITCIFKDLMIRHTKDQSYNGRQELLQLHGLDEKNELIELNYREQLAYGHLVELTRLKFKGTQGMPEIQRNMKLRSLLLPLRQACSFGSVNLARIEAEVEELKKSNTRGKPIQEVDDDVVELALQPFNLDAECTICLDPFDDPKMTPCRHVFCRECILGFLPRNNQKRICPICREAVGRTDLQDPPAPPPLPRTPMPSADAAQSIRMLSLSQAGFEDILFESKLKALLRLLQELRKEIAGIKVLVFSQFSKTLKRLNDALTEQKVHTVLLTGDMSTRERDDAKKEFDESDHATVFLLSVRSGAVGLTLTKASHVFMFEPCLNPALTAQAVNRVYRIGQERKVHITHLVAKSTLEEELLKIVDYHSFRSSSALDVSAGSLQKDVPKLGLAQLEALLHDARH